MIINLFAENGRYQAILKKGIFNHLNSYLDFNKKILFIIDENVSEKFYKKFTSNGIVYKFIALEKNKSIETVMEIIEILNNNNFSRDDYIVSIGGGITSDVAGFASSIYKRGIKWISIPTTTLAMIDASVGGKTGINYQNAKNQIGNFYFPEKVLIDVNVLKTLDKRNFNNGLCEAIKIGITLEKSILDLMIDPYTNLMKIIEKSIKAKNKIVKLDIRDYNARHVLNFGHTIGHALEMVDNDLLHGEAILIGMHYVSSFKVKKIIRNYMVQFDISDRFYDFNQLIPYLLQDKKIEANKFKIVLANDILDYTIKDMDLDELKSIYERR
ncbi:MAG: 3-dehydroquinate synthase [Erysipelotrichales bacterium]|nr:3-dehydroquinate synthase [Erysipelotrichales bacterium]